MPSATDDSVGSSSLPWSEDGTWPLSSPQQLHLISFEVLVLSRPVPQAHKVDTSVPKTAEAATPAHRGDSSGTAFGLQCRDLPATRTLGALTEQELVKLSETVSSSLLAQLADDGCAVSVDGQNTAPQAVRMRNEGRTEDGGVQSAAGVFLSGAETALDDGWLEEQVGLLL